MTTTTKDKLRTGFLYYLLSTVLLALIFLSYLLRATGLGFMDFGGWVYYAASCLSHAALFAALPYLLLYLPAALLKAPRGVCGGLMCGGEVLVMTLFIVNAFVYNLYHFHINGLVVDLLTGPGATEIFVFSPGCTPRPASTCWPSSPCVPVFGGWHAAWGASVTCGARGCWPFSV
jgi:membrane-anchored protein YejM (alkaline phosphatase superfamily)